MKTGQHVPAIDNHGTHGLLIVGKTSNASAIVEVDQQFDDEKTYSSGTPSTTESRLAPVDRGFGAWSFVCWYSVNKTYIDSLLAIHLVDIGFLDRGRCLGFPQCIWGLSSRLSQGPLLRVPKSCRVSASFSRPAIFRYHVLYEYVLCLLSDGSTLNIFNAGPLTYPLVGRYPPLP